MTQDYYKDITPAELLDLSHQGKLPVIIDVREDWETNLAAFPLTHVKIPQAQLWSEFHKYDADQLTVITCHHGVRSAQACMFLKANGFNKVYNLKGGIDAWSRDINDQIPRY